MGWADRHLIVRWGVNRVANQVVYQNTDWDASMLWKAVDRSEILFMDRAINQATNRVFALEQLVITDVDRLVRKGRR